MFVFVWGPGAGEGILQIEWEKMYTKVRGRRFVLSI